MSLFIKGDTSTGLNFSGRIQLLGILGTIIIKMMFLEQAFRLVVDGEWLELPLLVESTVMKTSIATSWGFQSVRLKMFRSKEERNLQNNYQEILRLFMLDIS